MDEQDPIGDLEVFHTEVPHSTLVRWFLYDHPLKDKAKLEAALGLSPISEEGREQEEKDSLVRRDRIEGLRPYMAVMAELTARSIAETYSNEEYGFVDKEVFTTFCAHVGMSALITAFASAVELGLMMPTVYQTTIRNEPHE